MTSQINPQDINGNYPVAGQPNNTKGFRDNFTNTKTNFEYAANEITELQNKSVLKQALTGGTLDNNMNDALIYAAKIQDFSATAVQIATTSGLVSIDYTAGHYQRVSTTGSIQLGFSNWPANNSAGWVRVVINITNVAHTVTLPAEVSVGTTGIQGLAGSVITFAATGTYTFEFVTYDSGATITIQDLSRPLNRYTNGVTSNSATAGIGYATGAGGTVTQLTSKSTGVTLNKVSGQITMNNASLAAATEVSFTLTNSAIAATDVVYTCIGSGATAGAYNTQVDAVGTGSCRISIGNKSTGPLSEALVLNFVVIKSVAG
jgi:hypothetical protein